MHDRHDFLVEIGTEELPPKSLQHFLSCFSEQMEEAVIKADLQYDGMQSYVTPRRMGLLIQNLSAMQQDKVIDKIGPLVNLAYDDQGQPTAAALGFAKSCGVSVAELNKIDTPKGESLVHRQHVQGKSIQELAPNFVKQALAELPIPKPMRWGSQSHSFIRPVHWLVLMYGTDVIPCELFDLKTKQQTYGHRFHHPEPLVIDQPNHYATILKEKGYVIANYNERKDLIREQIMALGSTYGQVIIDEDLLDEVTGLVEWPVPLIATFDKRFLDVPKEALISAMKIHQKCFPLVDSNNDLLPYFITVTNLVSQQPDKVITGNERVMRARLADAEFFYHSDIKNGIEHYLQRLQTVVFQNKLGTLHDKANRIAKLAHDIAQIVHVDPQVAHRAGLLTKADLTSEMVGEFPELQGIMGYYYALHNNEDIEVAIAIKEHYRPRFSGDTLPTTVYGEVCAIADRLDTLVGIFGINQAPTGEKDPFALRRSALGLLRILIEKQLPLDLEQLLIAAAQYYPELPNGDVVNQTLEFCLERLKTWYLDKGISASAFASVLARRPTAPLDFDYRIHAIHYFQQLPEAEALASANKRVSNIFKQTPVPTHTHFNYALIELDAEKELADIIEEQSKTISELCETYRYQDALSLLARLRNPIDRFFEEVMVMVDDETLRDNRLLLLHNLRQLFLHIADISLLQKDHR